MLKGHLSGPFSATEGPPSAPENWPRQVATRGCREAGVEPAPTPLTGLLAANQIAIVSVCKSAVICK